MISLADFITPFRDIKLILSCFGIMMLAIKVIYLLLTQLTRPYVPSFLDNLLEFFEKCFPFGDGAGAGIQCRVPLRAELFDEPFGALQRVGDLLAAQLAL